MSATNNSRSHWEKFLDLIAYPRDLGYECHVCYRQVYKNWKTCPGCHVGIDWSNIIDI